MRDEETQHWKRLLEIQEAAAAAAIEAHKASAEANRAERDYWRSLAEKELGANERSKEHFELYKQDVAHVKSHRARIEKLQAQIAQALEDLSDAR